jgi:hypothetical protein
MSQLFSTLLKQAEEFSDLDLHSQWSGFGLSAGGIQQKKGFPCSPDWKQGECDPWT